MKLWLDGFGATFNLFAIYLETKLKLSKYSRTLTLMRLIERTAVCRKANFEKDVHPYSVDIAPLINSPQLWLTLLADFFGLFLAYIFRLLVAQPFADRRWAGVIGEPPRFRA